MAERDLHDGQHRNPTGRLDYFPTAFFHHPEELRAEAQEAGLSHRATLGVEGPGWLLQDFPARWADPAWRERLLAVARAQEAEPSVLGARAPAGRGAQARRLLVSAAVRPGTLTGRLPPRYSEGLRDLVPAVTAAPGEQLMAEQILRAATKEEYRCCVVGGGPAGMMLGLLLARAGVDVVVLEKHGDFLRDFRGDTIHPSTLELMHELGLLSAFLQRPHQEARQLTGYVGDSEVVVADFTHLPTRCPFIAFMPQWDFLDFLAERGRQYATFHLRMRAQVTDLVREQGRVVGVRATTPDGPLEVRADLVVGADGRHSVVRERAGLKVTHLGAPMDVLWMRLPRQPGDPRQPAGRFNRGKIFIMLDRGDYWQCGYVIAKGGIDRLRARGLKAFQDDLADIAPFLRDRVGALNDWDEIKLLTVALDRLQRWYGPGLLCIGDAAHAMSPIGGVGINLAIQDAVAAANVLAAPLRAGGVTPAHLGRVQRRRELPTRLTQRLQIFLQNRVIRRVLASQRQFALPWPLRLLRRFALLRRIPARLIGMGFRPEHIQTPDVYAGGHPA
jgi:2-polyprenyl-6-methoxyphenol hydroxylase-like FAD-dependent oxidoreductase